MCVCFGGTLSYVKHDLRQAFFVRFRKTQGAKLKTFFKTQGSKLKVFSKNSMYRRFFNDFFKKKTHFVANFVCKTQKLCWKLLHFDVKSILWLRKINIYHLILPFLSRNLSIFPETQQFFKLKAKTQGKSKTQGKNSTKIQNSRQKLNDFDEKTQGTGGFYCLCPRENRTQKKPVLVLYS